MPPVPSRPGKLHPRRAGRRVGLLVGLSALAAPAAARAQSFDQALAMAYESNPQRRAARARLRGVDKSVPQALPSWRPRVTIGSQYGIAFYDNTIDRLHVPEHRPPQDDELRVDRNLFAGGRISSQFGQAKAEVLSERANLRATETQVLLAAGIAYLDGLRDRRVPQLQQDQAAILERTVRASRTRLAAAAITDADFAQQAEARLANQMAAADTAVARRRASEAVFEQRLGRPPGDGAVPARAFAPPASEWQAAALSASDKPGRGSGALRTRREPARRRRGARPAGAGDGAAPPGRPHAADRAADLHPAHQHRAGPRGAAVAAPPGGEEHSRIRRANEESIRSGNLMDQARRLARQPAISA